MRNFHLSLAFLLFTLVNPVNAQQTTAVENSGLARGFELQGHSLYWWHYPTFLDGDNTTHLRTSATLIGRSLAAGAPQGGYVAGGDLTATLPYTASLFSFTPLIAETGVPPTLLSEVSVVRDAEYFYFCRGGVVKRRSAAAGTGAVEESVTRFDGFSETAITASGCCLIQEDRLWYHNGGTVSSVALNGAPVARTESSHFVTPGGGTLKKMTVHRGQQVVLLTDGRLYFKNELTGAFSGQILVGSGVNDFAVRTDRVTFLGANVDITAVYGGDAAGVWRWNPAQAVKEYLPAGANGPQGAVQTLALDGERLFICTQAVVQGQGLRPHTWRKIWPRTQADQPWNAPWENITTTLGGSNYRSDGRYLYGLDSASAINVISTNAPALKLDVEARGLEVVQVIQDLNNDIPLIAGREAWVRGYAWIAENTTVFPSRLRFPAELEVIRDGATLVRLAPVNDPFLGNVSSHSTWRPDVNRGYLFRVPGELIQAGNTEFRFTVNPGGRLPELPGATRSNSVSDTVAAVAKGPTLLPFVRLHTTFGMFDAAERPGTFRNNIERARSLLPVSRLIPILRSNILYKPVPTICEDSVAGIPVYYPCIADRSFDMAEDDSLALGLLQASQWLNPSYLFSGLVTSPFDHSVDIHWCGMVPAAVTGFNGIGYTPPLRSLLVRLNSETVSNAGPWDMEWGGRSLAHELGHNYGRNHVNWGSPDGPFDPHPVPLQPGLFAGDDMNQPETAVGFDSLTLSAVPSRYMGREVGDLMSYASSRWTSRQTYLAILNAIPDGLPNAVARRQRDVPGPVLLVRGMIDATQSAAAMLPCYVLPPGAYPDVLAEEDMARSAALPADHPLQVRAVDASGVVLDEFGLLLNEAAHDEDHADPGKPVLFGQFSRWSPATAKLQILRQGTTIGEFPLSPSAPIVSTPAVTLAGDALRVAWAASDADGDRLTFTVHFSNDDGAHWTLAASNTVESSCTVSAALLPGGAECRFRVLATDGVRTALAASAPFDLPRRSPQVGVGGLVSGERLPYGTTRELTAEVTDGEDGALEDAGIQWTLHDLSRNTQRTANGPRFLLQSPAPGRYEITLDATDSDGMTGSTTIPFHVAGLTFPGSSSAPVLDGVGADATYADSPVLRIDLVGNPGAPRYGTVTGAHHGGRLYLCLNDLPMASGLARVRLLLDTDASGGSPRSEDLAIEISENGQVSQWRGNGVNWVPAPVPGGAISLVMLRGGDTWNAELSLPAPLFGGWDHDTGIGVVVRTGADAGSWPPGLSFSAAPSVLASAGLGGSPAAGGTPPSADAGSDRVLSPLPGEPILLDASGSRDPDGEPLTFQWEQLSGPVLQISAPGGAYHTVVAPDLEGAFAVCEFRVTVSDGTLTASDTVRLNLTARTPQILPESPSTASLRLTPQGVSGSFNWPGGTGKTVMLQSSTDLVAWQNAGLRVTDLFSEVRFFESALPGETRRFYRLTEWMPEPVQDPGHALRFDGSGGAVAVPHAAEFNSYPMTCSAYILTTTNDGQARGIVEKYTGGSFNGWLMFLHQGRVRAWYFRDASNYIWNPGGDGLGIDGGPVDDGFWHHCTFTVGEAGGSLYVDGALRASLPWTGTPGACSTALPLRFGIYSTTGFTGDLDNPSYWNRALTAPEVLESVRVSPNAGAPGLVSLWRFDDATGATAVSGTSPLYTGALSGSVQWVPSSAPIYRQ